MEARPLPDGAHLPAGRPHLGHERIVAAGIEDDELHLAGAGDLAEHARQRHGLVLDVGLLLQRGVDRDDVVDAADLDAVSGEVDHGPVGAGRQIAELLERAAERGQIGVQHLAHLAEAHRAQRGGQRLGVVGGIRQDRHVLVGAVADDECDAALGRRLAFGPRLGEPRQLLLGGRNRASRIRRLDAPLPLHDLLVVGHCQIDLALLLARTCAIAVGEEIIRVDAQRLAVFGNRFVELALAHQHQRAVVAGVRVARVELDRLLVIGQRRVQVAFSVVRNAAAVVGDDRCAG